MNTLPEAQIRSVIPDLSRRKPWSRSLNGATRPSQRRSNIRRWIWAKPLARVNSNNNVTEGADLSTVHSNDNVTGRPASLLSPLRLVPFGSSHNKPVGKCSSTYPQALSLLRTA
jgi:hypothetical protein